MRAASGEKGVRVGSLQRVGRGRWWRAPRVRAHACVRACSVTAYTLSYPNHYTVLLKPALRGAVRILRRVGPVCPMAAAGAWLETHGMTGERGSSGLAAGGSRFFMPASFSNSPTVNCSARRASMGA